MKVPFTNLRGEWDACKDKVLPEIERVMANGDFILRKDVEAFENAMAELLGVDHVVGVGSGTDALTLSLMALDLKPGSIVVLPGHTFAATLAAVRHAGLKPHLADVNLEGLLDLSMLPEMGGVSAIIPVHMNGRMVDLDALRKSLPDHVQILEDAAQALGSSVRGKAPGAHGDSRAACFSLHPMKILGAAGDGGFVATRNGAMAERLRSLRNHGQRKKGEHSEFGFCSRLDNLQAAILNAKLPLLAGRISDRRATADLYVKRLSGIPGLYFTFPHKEEVERVDTFSSFVIRSNRRDELRAYLRGREIETAIHWQVPLHRQPFMEGADISLPGLEAFSKTCLSLPIYPELLSWQKEYVADSVLEFFRGA